jgi:hypothetical protein
MAMGLIERSIRNRSNQKLAAEVFTQTQLSFDEVVAAVLSYCNAKNEEVTSLIAASQAKAKTRLGKWTASLSDPKHSHYYVSPHPEMRQVLIGFGQRPEPILAGKGNNHNGVWAARLSYPAGDSTVGIALLKWVINSDGVLRHKSFYESLLQNLHAAISSDAGQATAGAPAPSQDEPRAMLGQGRSDGAEPPTQTANAQAASVPDAAAAPGPAHAERTAALVEPAYTRAGNWITDAAAQFPFLRRHEIVGLAGMRALLAVDTGYHSSSYLTGQYTAGQLYGSLTHSLLRCNVIQHNGTILLTCGAPKPDLAFASDWQIKCMVTDDGTAAIEVPQYRHIGNDVRSAELLAQLREALTEHLASGVRLHLGEGPPSTEGLITTMPADAARYPDNDDSPFGHDYLGGVTAVYGEPLNLPARARSAVMAAISQSHFRSTPGYDDELYVASLAGGRPFDSGSVALRRAGENDQLVIRIPAGLPPVDLERSYRAALRLFDKIARTLKEPEPELSKAISEHVSHIAAEVQKAWSAASGTRVKDRPPGLWVQHWSRTSLAPMVPVAAARWYPIGVLATSPAQNDYILRAAEAADWVTTFKRTKPVLLPNGKPTNRHNFTSRRCGLLHNSSDQTLPYLRFASSDVVWDHLFKGISPPQAWFWEVNARPVTASALSRAGGLLFTTGWSHADGVLGYGENLLSMFRAFADVVSATDKDARIQTLYIAT